MALWNISNSASGCDLGNYEGASEAEALDALARDAGYTNNAEALAVTGGDGSDLLVTEVKP